MKTSHVKIAVRILEIWKVEAESADDASATCEEGKLIQTSDESLETDILSAKEV